MPETLLRAYFYFSRRVSADDYVAGHTADWRRRCEQYTGKSRESLYIPFFAMTNA